jgi:hypothetical protein
MVLRATTHEIERPDEVHDDTQNRLAKRNEDHGLGAGTMCILNNFIQIKDGLVYSAVRISGQNGVAS